MSLLWTLIHRTVPWEGLPALVTADRPANSGDHIVGHPKGMSVREDADSGCP